MKVDQMYLNLCVLKSFGGIYSEGVTPVPIPNTEVKLFSAFNSK